MKRLKFDFLTGQMVMVDESVSGGSENAGDIPAEGLVFRANLSSINDTTRPLTNNNSVTFETDTTLERDVAVFSGSNYLTFSDANLPAGNSARTYIARVNIASAPTSGNYYQVIGYGNFTGMNTLPCLDITSALGLMLAGGGNDVYADKSSGGFVTTGGWHLLVYTLDGVNETLYVDKEIVRKAERTRATSLNIGSIGSYVGLEGGFVGKLCDTAIYDRALSLQEILKLK